MSSNQEKINEITQTFSPKIPFENLQQIAKQHVELESDALYALLETLTSQRKPSVQDEYESKWTYFYLPIERNGELMCTAVSLFLSYKKNYSLTCVDVSRYGGVTVDKGSQDVPQEYMMIVDEISRFTPFVKAYGDDLLQPLYPYEWRVGRIKRKYVRDPATLLSQEEGDRLLAAYAAHREQNLSISEISLNDYLQTSAICYRAAFPEDIKQFSQRMNVETLSAKQLHKCWADQRHGGMLFLDDPNSTQEYMDWYRSRTWEGAHPFEIVYSGNIHGISLEPPDEKKPWYRLSVVDPFYRPALLKMVAALIEHQIPFVTYQLEKIVNYCRGEAYIDVNTISMRDETFRYRHTPEEQEKYFPHIEWDPIPILEPYSKDLSGKPPHAKE